MAKRTAAEKARRSELGQMLGNASLRQISKMLETGKVSEKDLRVYYSDLRANVNRQIGRIEKSDVPFIEKPDRMSPARSIKDTGALMKAIAEGNRFQANKSMSTVSGRRAVRDKTIETLHSRGMTSVNKSNYGRWIRFQQWYEQQAEKYRYGSDSVEIQELFEAADEQDLDSAAEFEDLFENFLEDGVF